ncbi:MAG: c-type cytochrome [Thermoleophilaceae bacterium]|nr:c-type cytochrome [Thermoleophilaceae bacterium]
MTFWIRSRGAATALAALAVGAVLSGCGSRGDEPDLVNGKTLFVGEGTCGSCHALARAGTSGNQGPDLDAAFGPAREVGQGAATVEGIVRSQIEHPALSSSMPPRLLTGSDARDVAAYVAFAAGRPGEDQGALAAAGAAQQSDEPAIVEDGVLTIPADPTGALAYTFPEAEAEAGQIEITMPNESPIDHNIAIEDDAGDVVGTGGESTISVDLDAGEYEYICTVPGHAEGGMIGTLAVE